MAEKDKLIEQLKQNFIEAKRAKEAFDEPLGEARNELTDRLNAVKTQWANENAELLDLETMFGETVEDAETALRDQLKEWFEANGDTKTYDENLSVRVNTKLEYELSFVTAWAKENAPFILVADKKQFEELDIARTLPFVTETETVSAVIKKL